MASSCVDRRSQTYLNQQITNIGPTTKPDGTYTVNQIDVFAQELADNIVAETNNNPIKNMITKFGDAFGQSVDYVNGSLRDYDATNYPFLDNRWNRGNVTQLEMADFMQSYNYTPNGLINQTPDVLLSNLNRYYEGDIYESILGGFCNSMNNLFNQIDAFYDLIGEIDGIINDALAAYAKFQALLGKYEGMNPLEILEEKVVKKLMKEIQEKIIDSVVKIYEKVMAAIENFNISEQIGDLVVGIDKSHTKYIMTRKERMCNELTEEQQKKMKNKLKGFMDYAFGLFEQMDLATMQFLVARFCALASNVEALVNEIKNPLDDYGNRYQRVIKRLQTIGNQNTSTAIRNGAIRFSREKRQNDINSLNTLWNEGNNAKTIPGYDTVDVEEITAEDYKNLPPCMNVIKGSDGTFKLEGDVFDEEKGIGLPAYTHLDLDVKVYLKRLQEIYGNTFIITNGWVSQQYNQEILKKENDNPHLSGLVIDIKVDDSFKSKFNSLSDAERNVGKLNEIADWTELFTKNAKQSGFQGVIIYDNHIHLDIREILR
jgi:hypothetical protein